MAITWLGEATAAELFGWAAVDFALATRPGSPEWAQGACVFGNGKLPRFDRRKGNDDG